MTVSNDISGIKKNVLNKIKPDISIKKDVDAFLSSINDSLSKLKIKAIAVAGGSIAKDTNLRNDFDIDIFVKFDVAYKDDDLSMLLEKVLGNVKGLSFERVHGSRDYFQVNNKLSFEIVPVLDIKKTL